MVIGERSFSSVQPPERVADRLSPISSFFAPAHPSCTSCCSCPCC